MAKQLANNGRNTAKTTVPTLLREVAEPQDTELRFTAISFFADCFGVHFSDGRIVALPYWWFPRLAEATDAQRNGYRLQRSGSSLWWDELDDGLYVEAVLEGKPDVSGWAIWWRNQHGFAWFDAWRESRMTDEQRTMLRERDALGAAQDERRAKETVSETASTSNGFHTNGSLMTLRPTDLLAELSKYSITLSKQRLHQLTRGEVQVRNGKEYRIKPMLQAGQDFVITANRIRYTPQALERLKAKYGMKKL